MNIIAGAFIDSSKVDIEAFFNDLKTYINDVDKVIVNDFNKEENKGIKERLENNFAVQLEIKIAYQNRINYGEAENYHSFMKQAQEENFSHALIMESGYYFAKGTLTSLKEYLESSNDEKIGILTPYPLYTCMEEKEKEPNFREIKGSHIIGALINVKHYHNLGSFNISYYQGYVDYEYCLRLRLAGYKIILAEHCVLWNRNYNLIERSVVFQKYSSYEKPLVELYYETRNRHFMWAEYAGKDHEFIKADKKSFKQEMREIKFVDPHYELKKECVKKARRDFKNKLFYKSDLFN